jgi:hypothetical protein
MKNALGQPLQRATEEQNKQRDDNRYSEQPPVTESADDAQDRANPNRRRRRESGDVAHRIAQDNSGAEKADTSQEALDDARNRVRIGRMIQRSEREKRSESRAHTNESVRPQSGRFPMQLAIQPKNRAEDQRGPETQQGLFISTQHGGTFSRKYSAPCKHLVAGKLERYDSDQSQSCCLR